MRASVLTLLTLSTLSGLSAQGSDRVLGRHDLAALAVAVSPRGDEVVSASGSVDGGVLVGQVRVWDATTGRMHRELRTPRGGMLYSVAWSRDGAWLVAGGATGRVWIWNARTGGLHRELDGLDGPVRALALSPDSQRLAAAGLRGEQVRVWGLPSGEPQSTLAAHVGGVAALAWSGSGMRLATVGRDRTLKVWRQAASLEATVEGLEERTLSLAFAPDGLGAAIGAASVALVELVTGGAARLGGFPNTVTGLAYSPDGSTLAAAFGDPVMTADGVEKVAGLPEFQTVQPGGTARRLEPSRRGFVRLYGARTGELLRDLSALSDLVWAVAWTPDGSTIVSAHGDGTVRAWAVQ